LKFKSERSSLGSYRGRWRVFEPEGAGGEAKLKVQSSKFKSDRSSTDSDRGRWRVFEPEGAAGRRKFKDQSSKFQSEAAGYNGGIRPARRARPAEGCA
jgi:hypothetical protein